MCFLWVKGLHMHRDLGWNPSTHVKARHVLESTCNPSAVCAQGMWAEKGPYGLVQLVASLAPDFVRDLKNKEWIQDTQCTLASTQACTSALTPALSPKTKTTSDIQYFYSPNRNAPRNSFLCIKSFVVGKKLFVFGSCLNLQRDLINKFENRYFQFLQPTDKRR